MAIKVLKPIKETTSDYDDLEAMIARLFKEEIYIPLIKELKTNPKVLKNAIQDLVDAITSGQIRFNRGRFTGRFSAALTRELKRIGAEWDRKQGAFLVPHSKLPIDIKQAVALSESRFTKTIESIKRKLGDMLPEQIAEKLRSEPIFDAALWKVEKEFKGSVKGITVAPSLTEHQAARISAEYTKNLQLYIKDWVEKETQELRQRIEKRSLAGQRFEGVIKEIQKSYGVSKNKAKFLARQETSLMMTKFKQTRYEDAGVKEYIWTNVVGSPKHPVRPMHKELNGKVFSWNNPPIVDEKGERKNPGQDYNCRCFARPIVRF